MRVVSLPCVTLAAVLSLLIPATARGETATPEDPAQFESDPLIGGSKIITTSFKSLPKWDRVRLHLIGEQTLQRPDLAPWVEWAEGLRGQAVKDRLYAINRRVNKDFKYQTDNKIWGKPDYWETPDEALGKGRLDCEGFAIFKMYMGYRAGIEAEDMAILIGKILSTGEAHAILLAGGDGVGYLLDNRSPYVVDTDTFTDFKVLYSVDFNDVWMYPALFQR
jgi:predicted transglutaminase-like cysteine proteinase